MPNFILWIFWFSVHIYVQFSGHCIDGEGCFLVFMYSWQLFVLLVLYCRWGIALICHIRCYQLCKYEMMCRQLWHKAADYLEFYKGSHPSILYFKRRFTCPMLVLCIFDVIALLVVNATCFGHYNFSVNNWSFFSICFTLSLEPVPCFILSTSSQSLYLWLTCSCASHIIFLYWFTTHIIHNSLTLSIAA